MKQRLPVNTILFNALRFTLPVALFLVLIILAIPGFMFFKIVRPPLHGEPTDPSFYMLQSSDIAVTSKDGDIINGWWIPVIKESAGILLAPGYGMNRSDALSLAAVLHKRGFNVFLYAQRGSSASRERSSTLGLKEKEDMILLLRFLQSMTESNPDRIGIWGVDVNAYASLWAAASIPEVRAIAADNPYSFLYDFINVRIQEEFGMENRLLQFGCRQIFRVWYMTSGALKNEQIPVEQLSDRSFLFITGKNRPVLSQSTMELYDKLSARKEMVPLEKSRGRLLGGDDLSSYDMKVADFFEQNLK